jgi:phosphatidylinositol kinase/protein kinase (PI-3  family)
MLQSVVGRGDRDPDPVLFIQDNEPLFHVAFNCLFDRAKTFVVSETVSFRLTQNDIDPMGVLKADGSFRNFCELFMVTLRGRRQKLISVLRFFLCDPL